MAGFCPLPVSPTAADIARVRVRVLLDQQKLLTLFQNLHSPQLEIAAAHCWYLLGRMRSVRN